VTEDEAGRPATRFQLLTDWPRPFCETCPPDHRKRALFRDRARKQNLCAACCVQRIYDRTRELE